MTDLQCLICDYTVVPVEPDDQVLILLGVSSIDAGRELIAHMESHTLTDWVKAFKMADAYIAQLEAELEEAQESASELARAPVMAEMAVTPIGAPIGPAAASRGALDPAEQARLDRQAQIQAIVQAADPDQTLIPRIPDAQRPEGMVGVKY